jgi:predicted anti-sigma-YlaC factor YlaD
MTCREARKGVHASLDGILDHEEAWCLSSHLKECRACNRRYRRARLNTIVALGGMNSLDPDAALRAKRRVRHVRAARRDLVGKGVAAAAMVLMVLLVLVVQRISP